MPKCDKLIVEAFKGIEATYKLDDALAEIPDNQKFNSKQMIAYLSKAKEGTRRGISPHELKASGIMDMYKGDYQFTAKEWKEDFAKLGGRQRFAEQDVTSVGLKEGYADVTLGTKGKETPTYKESLITGRRIPKAPENVRHYPEFDTSRNSIIGWRRTHQDNINGKDTTVLNEWESDWAQTERSGRGIFEGGESIEGQDLVAKFPMSEKKFHQYQIVASLDEAIKNGTNRVAIPIQRENELVGTEGVTKFYENLNKSILPDIRKKLDKQGLKIKVSKESYKEADPLAGLTMDDLDSVYGKIGDKGLNSSRLAKYIENMDLTKDGRVTTELEDLTNIDNFISKSYGEEYTMRAIYGKQGTNELWILDIVEKPKTKVKWDVYGVLGAIGLSEMADKLKEAEEN